MLQPVFLAVQQYHGSDSILAAAEEATWFCRPSKTCSFVQNVALVGALLFYLAQPRKIKVA